jgi:DNA-binding MarR family transcriptional regulator
MSNLRLVVSNDEPGAARHNDPDTSQFAAQSISATHLEWIVYAYLFKIGHELTALEIARGMRMDIRSVSPRMKPLEKKNGVVRMPKRYCINDAGNPTLQTTWLALP